MLGQFNLLPLLKGWEYKSHILSRTTVIRGAPPIPLNLSEKGWLLSVGLSATDAYGTLNIAWQGANIPAYPINILKDTLKMMLINMIMAIWSKYSMIKPHFSSLWCPKFQWVGKQWSGIKSGKGSIPAREWETPIPLPFWRTRWWTPRWQRR